MVSCNADTYPSYSHALTKKRKAHEANLHLHDDSSAPQIQCRYAPPSPVGLPQGTGARIALRNSTIPAKQVHHVPDCTTGLIVPGSSGSIPTFTNYANQTAVAASKTCPKPAAAQGDYAIVVGEMLRSSNESYEVLAFLGRGTFGQVVKCRCSSTKRCVAIKILKNLPSYLRQGNVEIQILQTLSQQDTESHNIVRAIECFQHKNHMCFVFELLEQNLYEYLKSNKFRPLSLLEIRPITQQVLTALSKLKSLGLIHADLKPENIMLVSSTTGIMRYRVKVIDFGSACHSSKAVQNTYLQSRYYRAPEILLGLPFNEAIDMWSLGCVIAELFLGWPLYPGSSEYDQMRYIVETQGPPPPDLLQNAGKCSTFFIRDPYHCDWRLKTQEEYTLETGQQAKEARKYFFTSLSQICEVPGVPSPSDPDRELDIEDRQQFASLLSLMLKMRPSERVVPDSALLHPFITMLHLQAYPFSKRFHESLTLMQVCHEATRRQHLLSARSNLQQFSSLPSLHEHSSTGIISTAPSPDSSTTKAMLGPEASISLPHTSMCHPSGSAVAYYAAAAVAAALTKPASQSVVEERMFSDPNNLRHYRMPNLVNDTNQQSSVTIFNNTQSCATAMEPSPTTVFLAHPKADVYQSTQDVHSGFLGNRVSVPYSLSLYDLVAASGNALSLLNAVAAPVSSNFVAASVSNHQRVSSHSSRGCLYQLRQPPINRSELDPRLPAEQAEEAALVLSSYIGQEQSQLHRCEPYISRPLVCKSRPEATEAVVPDKVLPTFLAVKVITLYPPGAVYSLLRIRGIFQRMHH
ncbi:kinase domain protein [Opisthorchis viverrini]|uniref:Kinase domain protein n=1 Tax=Opisthorchis viverrini TaxID=6198 RepID=A0A1S8X0P6_OPIVI|nr:kinase domain protein [Opisthorchis viverrini]